MSRQVAVIGSSIGAAQAALTLAEMGIEVSLITSSHALNLDTVADRAGSPRDMLDLWPLLLRAGRHPRVTLYTDSEAKAITGRPGGRLTVRGVHRPRFVRADLCTACGRCEESCSVKVPFIQEGRKTAHSAIHGPVSDAKKVVPSAYYIEKSGLAPCRVSCPLGINVQGFISLLSRGKVDEALALINEVAPLAGVLGRVCTHPCEAGCKRIEVDSPVFIRALHRYAADNAAGIKYRSKVPLKSRREKIALVGSGPAGLAAAWELARRGYHPTIFESHAVIGGMLATGIPRFRLPREVRDREVEAIRAIGVDIKTGVTVGRDVTISDLRERGYRAFFIGIGAHENNKLDIPGEELEGVVDSTSLLFALNLKVGASVGSNVVVIGGGNSAIDSARTAKRRSKGGTVRVLYRRTREEMTAVEEEVEEAIKEGVLIDYLTAPVEILGDGYKVTGIRCQRMVLGEVGEDGRRRPEPVPGSEYVIEADHVVAAIGQHPDFSELGIRWLETDKETSTIKVDPLTLETNIPGIFAGGDCVTGPNNVVEAVGAGLKAAESIDRYLRGRDLRKGRSLEKPDAVEVNLQERDILYYKRARMGGIPYAKRMGSYEETTVGLPAEVALREASRCLNCGLCSECRECERVCEQGAVFHKNAVEPLEVHADLVMNCQPESTLKLPLALSGKTAAVTPDKSGIYSLLVDEFAGIEEELFLATSLALKAAARLSLREGPVFQSVETEQESDKNGALRTDSKRMGIFLCRCGGSISSVIDFNRVTNEALMIPDICTVQEVSQACSEEGAKWITRQADDWRLGKLVVAACRCCGFDQICFSCTDRRTMCGRGLGLDLYRYVEFANIREQCAWVHQDDPDGATRKAMRIISSAISRAKASSPRSKDQRSIMPGVLVLGSGIRGESTSRNLAAQGIPVSLVSGPGPAPITGVISGSASEPGIDRYAWPGKIGLEGAAGNFEIDLKYGKNAKKVAAGAIVVEVGEAGGEVPYDNPAFPENSLLRHMCTHVAALGRETAIKEANSKNKSGIFLLAPAGNLSDEDLALEGDAMAAKVSAFIANKHVRPLAAAVKVEHGLCRGCGDCAAVCPYIVIRPGDDGALRAHIDGTLCIGCGACMARCPTGAISEQSQSNDQLLCTLEAVFKRDATAAGVE